MLSKEQFNQLFLEAQITTLEGVLVILQQGSKDDCIKAITGAHQNLVRQLDQSTKEFVN